MPASPFAVDVTPDWEALRDCILRKGTPRRVHHIELFLDHELKIALCERFGLMDGVDPGDPHFGLKREIAVQRYCGYDYVRQGIEGLDMPMNRSVAADTAELAREGGRSFMNEHRGPDHQLGRIRVLPLARPAEGPHRRPGVVPEEPARRHVRHRQRRLRPLRRAPHLADGLRDLCYALYDERDLVKAIADRLVETYEVVIARFLQFDRVKIIWGSDDMGFKTGTLISPNDLREFVLPGHRLMAKMSHDAGRPYLLHACGKLTEIMEDLIEDVRIDARHSFEDTIEPVTDAYEKLRRPDRDPRRHRRGLPLPLQRGADPRPRAPHAGPVHARGRLLPGQRQQRGQLRPDGPLPGDGGRGAAVRGRRLTWSRPYGAQRSAVACSLGLGRCAPCAPGYIRSPLRG